MKNRISHIIFMLANYLRYIILKINSKKPIRVYYWKDHLNFGDLITPALLEYYGYSPIFFYPNRAQLVSTGSLIEHINKDYDGVILGTGAISETTSIEFKKASVVGLRGVLTKKALHIESDIVYGDPGLLAYKLLKVRNNKKFRIGIIPHYKDVGHPIVDKLQEKFNKDLTIIDVRDNPFSVLNKMDQCEYILSSSLHGLICADSLGIANGWVPFSDLIGGDFKFRDYYSVFRLKPKPNILSGDESLDDLIGYTSQIPMEDINKVKKDLEEVFINLSNI